MSTALPESTTLQGQEMDLSVPPFDRADEKLVNSASEPSNTSAEVTRIREDFSYRPMTPLTPIACVLGVLGSIAILGLPGLGVAFAGVIVSGFALWQIKRSKGYLGGHKLTYAGLMLSSIFFVSGTSLQVYSFATEVPDGCTKLNFTHDISKYKPVFADGDWAIAPEVQQYDGEQIFVKGYMYPTKQTEDITQFILVRDSGTCCFGGQPPITDMILVTMEPGKSVFHRGSLVAVAGTFTTKPPSEGGDLRPVYELKANYWAQSRSAFN
ncbi:MAG: DUF3299 domain-containing protein [Planctomycetota bacterium]|nr:DUF3299 domain-containing protein [Planctomycetota bacterium]MDA1212080.1 DUF3299 domain-containing protein [Planctomycetota bacterium]